jgi:hypothetical protein
MNEAVWTNGTQRLTGRWRYHWASDTFVIELDCTDCITGESRRKLVKGDTPEWGNWKRLAPSSAGDKS